MRKTAIPPELQLLKLNRALIKNASQLPSPVITVGGQCIMYWYGVYMDAYIHKPELTYMTSNDVDYVSRREGVEAIANIFNVNFHLQDVFTPPSIAVLSLIDKNTGKIKEDEQGLFLNIDAGEANIVDIIDRPTGFDVDDLSGKKLLLNTEPFLMMPEYHGDVMSHEKVRILNPIACIRSRFANATVPLGKDKRTEVERIKALAVPAYNFMLEKLSEQPFRESRKYIDYYCSVIWTRSYRRFQAEHNIPMYQVLQGILDELQTHSERYDLPEAFYTKELPARVERLRRHYDMTG